MQLTILGFNSATPTKNSAPTAQLLNIAERHFLIDCGEGTQTQLRKAKASFSKINHIFISHLHGDHVFGLIGLISTFQLLGREKPLTVYGPKGIKELIEVQLKLTKAHTVFELIFVELTSTKSELIYEDEKVEVFTIPLDHRIYTNGYLFREKSKLRNLNIDSIRLNPEIQICDYENLKHGKDFICEDGFVIKNESLTYEPKPSLSYAFCSDTKYKPDIIPIIKNVDLLYHEATFLHELKETALKTGHSTAKEAGIIAENANVGQLIIGHFSNRYTDYTPLLEEAKEEFNNTVLAEMLGVYNVCKEKPILAHSI